MTHPIRYSSWICAAWAWAWTLWIPLWVRGQETAVEPAVSAIAERVVLPPSVPDPMEPWNRTMWALNKCVMTAVIKPTSRVYRLVVVKEVRKGIGDFGKNLTYPGRLINNLLQGKWQGACDETYRFFCNTIVGVGGVFDVATRWNIPRSEADFGQTFGQWGWDPGLYLMLPFLGPSNDRDALGLVADTAANPLLYIAPYDFVASNPLTYLGPYSYLAYGVAYNNLADTVGESVRFSQAAMDPYSEIQYAWTFARANRAADFRVKGARDEASLQTIESVFVSHRDIEFPGHGRTRSVVIPATGRKLKFTYWLQRGSAPVVYILPGLGGHRLARSSLALAEMVYRQGFSAVCVSSAFHSEFMEHASTAALPAYLPVDGHDVHVALTAIDRRLSASYPARIGRRALLGYSMGAFHTLFIAAREPTNGLPLIAFDRFIAMHTPVRLLHGLSKLDEFYRAPLAWPAAERTANIENALLKVAEFDRSTATAHAPLPLDAIESRFLIGLNFRFLLRDIIFSSQRRNNQGILQRPIRNLARQNLYQEILEFSYEDYLRNFAVPYYRSKGLNAPVAGAIENAGDLRTYEAALRSNSDVRIVVNQNDFLLAEADLAWLRATIPAAQLRVFPQGGHLGNLSDPAVQQAVLDGLAGLRPGPKGPQSPPAARIPGENTP